MISVTVKTSLRSAGRRLSNSFRLDRPNILTVASLQLVAEKRLDGPYWASTRPPTLRKLHRNVPLGRGVREAWEVVTCEYLQ